MLVGRWRKIFVDIQPICLYYKIMTLSIFYINTIPSPIRYLFRARSGFSEIFMLSYLGFGKSYLIPETTDLKEKKI